MTIGQVSQCITNLACTARDARNFGYLAVIRDTAFRNLADRFPYTVHAGDTIHIR